MNPFNEDNFVGRTKTRDLLIPQLVAGKRILNTQP